MNAQTPITKPKTRVTPRIWSTRAGQVNWTILLWAIGVPLPIVLIVGLVRGCS